MPDYRPTYPPGYQPRETRLVYIGPPLKPQLMPAPTQVPVVPQGAAAGDGTGPRDIALAPAAGLIHATIGTGRDGRAPEVGARPGTVTHKILRAIQQRRMPVDRAWLQNLVGPHLSAPLARLVQAGHLKCRCYRRPEQRRPVCEFLPVARHWPALPDGYVLLEGDDGRAKG